MAEELIDPASGGMRRSVLRGLSRRAAPKGKGAAVHRTTKVRDAQRRPVRQRLGRLLADRGLSGR